MIRDPRHAQAAARRPAKLLRALALAGTAAVLAACGIAESRPTNFYLLDPIEPAAERPASGAVRLAVEEVVIPRYLDRQDLVVRDGANQLEVAGLHQWAEPLDATVTRVLVENLRLLLENTDVVELPARRADFNAELDLRLLRFEREADDEVVLVASWIVLGPDGAREIARERAVVREPVEDGRGPTGQPDYGQVVAAMNAALATLSRRVADSLRRAGAAS